jgi:hypothetical protein
LTLIAKCKKRNGKIGIKVQIFKCFLSQLDKKRSIILKEVFSMNKPSLLKEKGAKSLFNLKLNVDYNTKIIIESLSKDANGKNQ